MLKFIRKKIGIIGCGNMGLAIALRLKSGYRVFVFDKDKNKTKALSGIKAVESILDLVNNAEVIILAVKPQDFDLVLNEIKDNVKNELVISIAAGITAKYIENIVLQARVIRAMPNLPARVGAGITCLYSGNSAKNGDLNIAKELFKYLGKTLILSNEDMINAATAISGSGPGFFCDLAEGKTLAEIKVFEKQLFISSYAATAANLGFTPEQAKLLAEATATGTVHYLEEEGLSPEELKNMVTSKGGTTQAGLEVLRHDINNLNAAAEAALQRAKELSRG